MTKICANSIPVYSCRSLRMRTTQSCINVSSSSPFSKLFRVAHLGPQPPLNPITLHHLRAHQQSPVSHSTTFSLGFLFFLQCSNTVQTHHTRYYRRIIGWQRLPLFLPARERHFVFVFPFVNIFPERSKWFFERTQTYIKWRDIFKSLYITQIIYQSKNTNRSLLIYKSYTQIYTCIYTYILRVTY